MRRTCYLLLVASLLRATAQPASAQEVRASISGIVRDPFTGNRIPTNRISQKVLGYVPKPNRVTTNPADDN